MIASNAIELIGNTPIIKLDNLKKQLNLKSDIYAKLEYFNLTGSIKDRAVKSMIVDKLKNTKVTENTTIVEATSGNTGIAIASIAASLGIKAIIVMPDSMSVERRQFIEIYGAKIVLTPGKEGMPGAIKVQEDLLKANEDYFALGQFINGKNSEAHYTTTGPEILKDIPNIDTFIAGVGTGGTFTGVSKYIKENKNDVECIAVEPESSAVLSCKEKGPHKIEGIGAGFIPEIMNVDLIDRIITVSNEDAYNTAKLLPKTEGVFCGISSGAALAAAIEYAKIEENKNIVVILPDSGDRYLSKLL